MKTKKTILILSDWFLPGFKAGGPIQSIATLTAHLQHEFNFKIITTDRDFKSDTPYTSIEINKWTNFKGREVFYVSPENVNEHFLIELIKHTAHDVLYINSLFSKHFAINPLRWKKQGKLKSPIIMAPRGMFGCKALEVKPIKKKLFFMYAKWVGLFNHIHWQSTSVQETMDIKKHIGSLCQLSQVFNLPHISNEMAYLEKQPHVLRLCFIGRIVPIKNLLLAIQSLQGIKQGAIVFDIYGPQEDLEYWNSCEEHLKSMPSHIHCEYKGSLAPEEISTVISQYHALLLPTQTENFGHVIVETLLQQRPVIISNNTPWRNLQQYQAGFDIDLKHPEEITQSINMLLLMNNTEFQQVCQAAYDFINNALHIEQIKQEYINLFNRTF